MQICVYATFKYTYKMCMSEDYKCFSPKSRHTMNGFPKYIKAV